MKRLGLLAALPLLLITPAADAVQPPAKCKVVSVTSVTTPDLANEAWRTDTTTVSRCRGRSVTTVTTTFRSFF